MKPHILIAVDAFSDLHIATISNSIAGWATWERVQEDEDYRAKLTAVEIVIGWPEPEWVANSHTLRLLLCPSVGYENYQSHGLDAKQDIIFCNAGAVYAVGVAEHCMAMMLALTRRLPHYIRAMQTCTWQQQSHHGFLAGKTVCIVGLGSIGQALAQRCAALDMSVLGVRRDPTLPSPHVKQTYPLDQIHEAIRDADHVVVTLPGGKSTTNLFNWATFEVMKQDAYFFNVGRGKVVDEQELVKHLKSGHLAGAGLDVFQTEPLSMTSPLWTMDNVILTPHMAGYTADYAEALCDLMVTNLHRYHSKLPLLNQIDLARS